MENERKKIELSLSVLVNILDKRNLIVNKMNKKEHYNVNNLKAFREITEVLID